MSNYQLASATDIVPGATALETRAYCPPGTNVLGGGYKSNVSVNSAQSFFVLGAVPVHNIYGDYYAVTWANYLDPNGFAESNIVVTTTATCAATDGSTVAATAARSAQHAAHPEVVNRQHLTLH